MAVEQNTPAVVLKVSNYGEADRIVTALSQRWGKLVGIARGVRKSRGRFEKRLEPFAHVQLYFKRRRHSELIFITRAEAGDLVPFELGLDLGKFALGTYMLEISEGFTREEAQGTGAYEILVTALHALCQSHSPSALKQSFELQLIRWAGYGVDFARCQKCGRTVEDTSVGFAFAMSQGGLVCDVCRRGQTWGIEFIDRSSILTLRDLSQLPIEIAASHPPVSREVETCLNKFVSMILERRPRSLNFLEHAASTSAKPITR